MRALVIAKAAPVELYVALTGSYCGAAIGVVARGLRRRRRGGRALAPEQEVALALDVGCPLEVLDAVVVGDAVDVGALDDRARAQRIVAPDHDVGVLADLERADAVVDAQLARRVDRDHRERLVVGDVAPAGRLGRLGVQASRHLGAVRVERHRHALVRHDIGVVRNRVLGFDLVAPPVGEGRAACAVRGHLLGDLVSLEHVLERGDLEAHLVGHADDHQDLVRAIRVAVHEPLALEHFLERVELQVALRRKQVGRARRLLLVVRVPRRLVRLGPEERLAHHVLDALPGRRIASRRRVGRAGPLHVLAERELDAGHRAREHQVARLGHAPLELDRHDLAANRIGAAVHDVGRRRAARQVAVDVDVGRIEHVFHADHRAVRRRAFVDRVVGDVRVRVDDARRNELAGAVDDVGAGGNLDVGADGGDLAVAEHDRAVVDGAARHGQDRRVANRDDARRGGLALDVRAGRRPDEAEHQEQPDRNGSEYSTNHGDPPKYGKRKTWTLPERRADLPDEAAGSGARAHRMDGKPADVSAFADRTLQRDRYGAAIVDDQAIAFSCSRIAVSISISRSDGLENFTLNPMAASHDTTVPLTETARCSPSAMVTIVSSPTSGCATL